MIKKLRKSLGYKNKDRSCDANPYRNTENSRYSNKAERYIYYDFTPYLMSQSYTRLFGLLPMWPRLSTTDSMLKIKLLN